MPTPTGHKAIPSAEAIAPQCYPWQQRRLFVRSQRTAGLSPGELVRLARVDNPWLQLPASPPFVLPADHPRIEAFNKCLRPSQAKCRIDLNLYPAPWMGNPQAPLVVLSRNPSISPGDREAHQSRDYVAALRANIQDDPAGQVVVGLLERFRYTPTGLYWRPRFKDLIEHVGSSDELAGRVLVVELHGYRSEGEYRPITLPSQAYGFELVRAAMRRHATIVFLVGIPLWRDAVPELRAYPNVIQVRSAIRSYLTPRNLGPDGFERVLAALD